MELLLNYNADPNLRDGFGRTPLFAAVENNNEPIVEVLLKGGADPRVPDETGKTAIDIARENLTKYQNAKLRGNFKDENRYNNLSLAPKIYQELLAKKLELNQQLMSVIKDYQSKLKLLPLPLPKKQKDDIADMINSLSISK